MSSERWLIRQNMVHRGLARSLGISRRKRLDENAVRLGHSLQVSTLPKDIQARLRPDMEPLPHRKQRRISRGLKDDPMEPGVELGKLDRITGRSGALHTFDLFFKPIGQRLAGSRSTFRRVALELSAHIVDFGDFVIGNDPNARAFVVARLDKPDCLQLPNRFSDRSLARVEFRRDTEFNQSVARLQGSGQNLLHQMIAYLRRQRRSNDLRLRHQEPLRAISFRHWPLASSIDRYGRSPNTKLQPIAEPGWP